MTEDHQPTAGGAGPPGQKARLVASLTVALAVAALLVVVYWYRAVFVPLLLAVAIAYIFEPLVQWFIRKGCKRFWAVTILLLSFLLVSVSSLGWLAFEVVQFVSAVTGVVEDGVATKGLFNQGVHNLFEWIDKEIPESVRGEWTEKLSGLEFWQNKTKTLFTFLGQSFQSMLGSIELLMVGVLMPIYLFYVMLDLERIWAWIKSHLPARNREHTLGVFAQLHAGMSAFLRGRVIISFLKGALTAVGLLFCGTPMAVVVGLMAGLLSIVPFLGPALGFITALALTLSEQMSVTNMLLVIAVFVIAEIVEGLILTPMVMRQGADLHPLTILFCVVFWGAVFGIFGVLVAIPLTLVVKVLFQEYVMPSVRSVAAPS